MPPLGMPAFELVQLPALGTTAFELIQKPPLWTTAIELFISRRSRRRQLTSSKAAVHVAGFCLNQKPALVLPASWSSFGIILKPILNFIFFLNCCISVQNSIKTWLGAFNIEVPKGSLYIYNARTQTRNNSSHLPHMDMALDRTPFYKKDKSIAVVIDLGYT